MDGTVYLIHFEKPYKHARHYIGWSNDVNARFERHHAGNGSPLLRAVKQAGVKYQVVRTWGGDRHLERRLKNWKKARQLCPVCNPKICGGVKYDQAR